MGISHHSLDPFPSLNQLQHFSLDSEHFAAMPIANHPVIPRESGDAALVTVIPVHHGTKPNEQWIKSFITDCLGIENYFGLEFLSGLVFITESRDHDFTQTAPIVQQFFGTEFYTALSMDEFGADIPLGPHLLLEGKLYKAFRLHDDVNRAFMMATRPHANSGPFQSLRIRGNFPPSLSVAVPARVPAGFNSEPLVGLRFAVKDLFDIHGLRTPAGNRAFYDLSTPARATAPVVQKLIDAGAYLLGTLKLGSLIAREEPAETANYNAPFNPRADSHQSTWSNSGGSGAAVAAYDWLDFTIGTDTTGSGRRPAMANGCFQLRLSHGLLSLENAVPSFPRFDSPCIFTRDLDLMEKVVGAWTATPPANFTDLPISIIYLEDYLPLSNLSQMKLIDAFLEDAESAYGLKADRVSVADRWEAHAPAEASGESLKEYLKDIGLRTFYYDVYHTLDTFRTEYYRKYNEEPYVNPVTRWRWNAAKTVTAGQHDEAMKRMDIYKEWFLKEILQVGILNTMLILPITSQIVDYRDVSPSEPTAPDGLDSIWIAPILGAPEVSLPIGEIKYQSRVSEQEEYLPVVVALMGSPGTDMALLDAGRHILKSSGRPTSVLTGRRMFQHT